MTIPQTMACRKNTWASSSNFSLNKGAIDCSKHNRHKILKNKKKEKFGVLVGHSAHTTHATHSAHSSRHSSSWWHWWHFSGAFDAD